MIPSVHIQDSLDDRGDHYDDIEEILPFFWAQQDPSWPVGQKLDGQLEDENDHNGDVADQKERRSGLTRFQRTGCIYFNAHHK